MKRRLRGLERKRTARSVKRRLRIEALEVRRALTIDFGFTDTTVIVSVDPAFAPDAVATEDHAIEIDLSAADTPEGATFAIADGPSHGALGELNPATGSVTYTPADDYYGPDAFTYTVTTAGEEGSPLASEPINFSIQVQAVNDRPTLAASDPAAVDEDTGVHFVPFWADYEPGAANELRQRGPTYSVSNVSRPAAFVAGPSVSTLGRLSYTLAPNAFGRVTFDVVVKDTGGTDRGGSDTSVAQTFAITINPINDPPHAEPDHPAVMEDSHENRLNVLANDTFAPDEDEVLSVIGVSRPKFGVVDIAADGLAIIYSPPPNYVGEDTFDYQISDGNGLTHSATVTVTVLNRRDELLATAAGPGGGPHVRVFDATTRNELFSFFAYASNFTGGVRVAVGDVNGDGVADVITGAGPSGGPHVRVFDGRDGQPLAGPLGSFFAYGTGFRGGIFVAAADVNGDGRDDIITGADAGGGPHVRVFNAVDGSEMFGWMAYEPKFTGGVRVAAADINADGYADIITAPGAGRSPLVRVYSGRNGELLSEFLAYAEAFERGVFVAAGDVNGGGVADIVTGAGAGGGPHVKAFGYQNGRLVTLASFFADEPTFQGGVTVGVTDLDGLRDAEIVVGRGAGEDSLVRTFDLGGNTQSIELAAYPGFKGGAFVAGNSFGAYYPGGTSGLIGGGTTTGATFYQLPDVPTHYYPSNPPGAISENDLDLVRAAVFEQWQDAGLPASIASLIHQVVVRQPNLSATQTLPPHSRLAARLGNQEILLPSGANWFIDPTPETDEEFAPDATGQLVALPGSAAEGRLDLVSALNQAFAALLDVEAHGDWNEPSALPPIILPLSVRQGVSPQAVDAILSEV